MSILDLSQVTPAQPVTAATVVLDLSVLGKIVQVRIKAEARRPEWPTYYRIVIYGDARQESWGMNATDAEFFLRQHTPMTGEAARRALQAATNAAEAMILTPVI